MRGKNKYILVTCFSFLFLWVCLGFNFKSNAQSLEGFVVDGASYDSIVIGKSSESDVKAAYGDKFKLINHQGYSYEMIYKELGLGFYYCQSDPNKEIFVIEIEAPSKAMTQKGIVLGESTFADVFRLYGRSGKGSSGFEYKGLSFYYEVDDEDEVTDKKTVQKTKVIKGTDHTPVIIGESTNEEVSVNDSAFDCIYVSDKCEVKSSLRASESTLVIDTVDDLTQKEIDAAEEKILRKKVVKQIDLIENTGLRQCNFKTPTK